MKIVVAGVLSTFLLAGSASAATVTLNCVGVPPVGLAPTELNGNIQCPQFNATGLTSITLSLRGDVEGTISLTNDNPTQTQNGSAATQVLFNFGPLAGFTIANPFLTVTASTGPISVPPQATQVFPVVGTNSASVSNNSNLAPYIGAGTFDLHVDTNTFLLLSFGGGLVTAQQVTTAAANAQITYEFQEQPPSEVPEPTTLALLGTGLLGAAIRRRRPR